WNFASAAILAELNHRNAAARIFGKIDQHFVSRERPRDYFGDGLGVVGNPQRARGAGSRLLADLFSKNRGTKSALGENNAAGQSGNACATDSDPAGVC